jgi:hypothetical protein
MQIDRVVQKLLHNIIHRTALSESNLKVEDIQIVPHEVKAPVNGGSMEDWCNFGQSPKHGSPNFGV